MEHTKIGPGGAGFLGVLAGGQPDGHDAVDQCGCHVRSRRHGMTAEARKALPITTGVLDYFPDALLEVATASLSGNQQHGLGPLHWDKSKSTDEADALLRHLIDRGKRDTDGVRHSAKVAWRALAMLQREIEAETVRYSCEDRALKPEETDAPCPHPPECQCRMDDRLACTACGLIRPAEEAK